jgi:integrase
VGISSYHNYFRAYISAACFRTSFSIRSCWFSLRSRIRSQTLEKANVKRVTLHGLRHTFATRWISMDNDIRGLSEILGHADVATTLRRYVHSDPTHKAEMMQKMGSYIERQAE